MWTVDHTGNLDTVAVTNDSLVSIAVVLVSLDGKAGVLFSGLVVGADNMLVDMDDRFQDITPFFGKYLRKRRFLQVG